MRDLLDKWMELKELETKTTEERRLIEDDLVKRLDINETDEGTQNLQIGAYKIKTVSRFTRKVDSDKVQEIAIENGLVDQMKLLFRWSAEINISNWKSSDSSLTSFFSPAITTKPGRPTFTITTEESK